MSAPEYSEDVAGVDEPAAEDLEQMGVPTDTDDRVDTLKQRIRWKARAITAERALEQVTKDEHFWSLSCVFLGVTWLLTMAALLVAVGT